MVAKRLARLSLAAGGEVDESVAEFALNRFSRADLKVYLFHLKEELARGRLFVSISGEPDRPLQDELSAELGAREMVVRRDESLGGGVRVLSGDDLIDASVKGLVSGMIGRLKKQ